MSFIDKLMFWKKEDPFPPLGADGLPHDGLPPLETPSSTPNFDPTPLGSSAPAFGALNEQQQPGTPGGIEHDLRMQPVRYPQSSPYSQSPQYPQSAPYPQDAQKPAEQDNLLAKELEIISSKLDFLKASLENINQRLANMERVNQQQKW